MADFTIKVTADHTAGVLRDLDNAKERILEGWGQNGVSYVKQIIEREGRIDTHNMIDNVSHEVKTDESKVYVGTPVDYAVYNEYGTGIYAEGGKGRKTPWFYVDAHGEGHWTHGMKPIHMFKNGIGDHLSEFKQIAENELKK